MTLHINLSETTPEEAMRLITAHLTTKLTAEQLSWVTARDEAINRADGWAERDCAPEPENGGEYEAERLGWGDI